MSTLTTLIDDEEPLSQQQDADQASEGQEDTEPGDPLEGREDLQKCLYDLYCAFCKEDRYPRLVEIMDTQQAHLYWRGLQYLWWSQRDECWNLPTQNSGLQIIPTDIDDMPRFEFVTNIYQAFGLSLISAIGQAPPRTRWFPEDAEKPEDVETAAGYSKLSKIIERWNPIQQQMQDEIFYFWTSGTVGAWTRYVSDDRFGTEEIEELEEQPFEDGAGTAPTSTGTTTIAKGREVITVVGALNLKRPQYARSQSEFHYLAYEEEIHYAKLRMAYPDIAEKINPGQAVGEDNGFERNARLVVMQGTDLTQQTGEAQSVLNTFARVWFRPEAFYHDKVKKDFRDELLELFPQGCRVFFSGSTYCESEAQSMDDCWAVTQAMPGDGQHRNALGSSMISVQDRFNTWSNIQAETYEYGLPITYRAGDTWDENADQEQRSEPGTVQTVILEKTADIRQRIMQIRNDSVSPDMLESMANLMGPVSQFLTGAFPALMGAGAAQGAAGDTASGYKMQMDQALGRCGVSYVRLKQFHADIQTIACRDYCRNASGRVTMPVVGKGGDFENEAIDIDALEGSAQAYPEGDETYPELWNVQRATFFEIMQTPQGQTLLAEPDNADLAARLIGIPNLVVPGADDRRQAMRIIGMLTAVVETVQADDSILSMSSEITDFAPYLDPDDDHSAMYQTANHWRLSDAGIQCQKTNPTGYKNVRQWMALQKQMIAPPPPNEKPASRTVSLSIDKMPPEAQAQFLAKEYGIEVSPEDFIAQAVMEKLKKSPKPTLAPAGQPALAGNQPQMGLGAGNA